MILFLSLSMYMTFIMTSALSPQKATLILILQTLVISLSLFYMFKFMWFSYMILMILAGGLLILFLYLCSLSMNNIYMPQHLYTLNSLTIIILLMNMSPFNLESLTFKSMSMEQSFFLTSKMFMKFNFNIYLFLVIYLLITLLITMTLMKKSNAPLRLLMFFGNKAVM